MHAPRPDRARPRQAAEVQGRPRDDGARRWREGEPDADRGLLVPALLSDSLARLDDAGTLTLDGLARAGRRTALRRQADPLPGRLDRRKLAVNGTVNDLAVAGARPLAITLSLVLEEGLGAEELRAEVEAIAAAASAAGVEVVAGDTKVVERGRCDSMYVTTTGIGLLDGRAALSPSGPRPGDRILVSGSIGEHGTAVMLARGEFALDAPVESDTCRCGRRPTRCWTRRSGAGDARRDARRRRDRAERAPPARRASRSSSRRRPCRFSRRSRAPARSSASTRCTSRTRRSRGVHGAGGRGGRARGAAVSPGLRRGGGDRRR